VSGNLTLALLVGVLYTTGTYLLLQRTLTRVVLGLGLLAHGANLLLLQAGGAAGRVPLIGAAAGPVGAPDGTADPLPQAMVLTAIVIAFGVSAFLLALAYRSWLLTDDDEVQDDLEDRNVLRLGREEEARRAAAAAQPPGQHEDER
jgi:multicomponent Na+:H+ antiporter subunit C